MTKKQKPFELPWWYRQVPRDFMSSPDVEMMTAEEIGSYFLLLQKAWLLGENCTLPNEPERLAKLSRVEKVADIVLKKFLVDKDGRLYNPRLLDEWKDALKRSKDGINSAKARWDNGMRSHSGRTATALASQCGGNATNTNTNTNTNKSKTVQGHASLSESKASSASPSKPTPSHGAVQLAAKLAATLGRQDLKPATLTAWAEQAEGLIASNGEETIHTVMEYAFESTDGFWRGRIYAMKNFVRCFKTMLKQSQQNKSAGKRSQDPLAQRAASLATGHDFSAMAKGDL
jgi:uncharacterized protein YdaU (DUF1376 family)